jgi:hypothetical protein
VPPDLAEGVVRPEDGLHRFCEHRLTHDRDEPVREVAQLLPAHAAVRLLDPRMAEREQAT